MEKGLPEWGEVMAIDQLRIIYQGDGNYEFDTERGKLRCWASPQDVIAFRQMEALENIAQTLDVIAERLRDNNDALLRIREEVSSNG